MATIEFIKYELLLLIDLFSFPTKRLPPIVNIVLIVIEWINLKVSGCFRSNEWEVMEMDDPSPRFPSTKCELTLPLLVGYLSMLFNVSIKRLNSTYFFWVAHLRLI